PRPALDLNWIQLTPGTELFEGDEVATIGDSKVSLKFLDGQTVTLGSNSLLVLSKAEGSRQRSYLLTLVQGLVTEARSAAREETKKIEIEVGGKKVIASSEAG